MNKRLLTALALAAFVVAPVFAQVPRGFTPQLSDQQKLENNAALSAKRYDDGVAALKAKNFAVAEGIFDEVLRENANHAEANFMMGVAFNYKASKANRLFEAKDRVRSNRIWN